MGFLRFAGEFGIGEALAYDLSHKVAESVRIAHGLAIVEPEGLLIDVAEQVEGLD